MIDRVNVWTYGGGLHAAAILCLIAQGRLPAPELAIMADTGRERSAVWRYLDDYAKPLLDQLGIPFVIASHDLATVDLYGKNGDLLLPVFTQTGKLPTFCSNEWKKFVVRRKLRELGYGPKKPITMWFGMSLDELDRMAVADVKWIKNHYPLVFDVKKRRYECELLIEDFGLPVPPKSACWMCPHLDNEEWGEIKRDDPADFDNAVALGRQILEADNQGGVFLHRQCVPLEEVDLSVKGTYLPLLECSASCWT